MAVGKIPRNLVDPEYVNFHLTQEKGKKKELLQRFIDLCTDSKVHKSQLRNNKAHDTSLFGQSLVTRLFDVVVED